MSTLKLAAIAITIAAGFAPVAATQAFATTKETGSVKASEPIQGWPMCRPIIIIACM